MVSAAIIVVIGIDEEPEEKTEQKILDEKIKLPVSGKVVDLKECSDSTFAEGLVGNGVLILPSEGNVYAPFDGTVEVVMDSHHALALKSDHGVETLIHVGIDTVELEGKPFTVLVKQGQKVKEGQLLMKFDMKMIQEAGKSTEVPFILTNVEKDHMQIESNGVQKNGANVLAIKF